MLISSAHRSFWLNWQPVEMIVNRRTATHFTKHRVRRPSRSAVLLAGPELYLDPV